MAAPRGLPLGRRAGVENIPGAGWGVGVGVARCGREASAGSLSLGTSRSQATFSVKAPGVQAQPFSRPSSSPARVPGPHTAQSNCERTQRPATFKHTEQGAQKGALAP